MNIHLTYRDSLIFNRHKEIADNVHSKFYSIAGITEENTLFVSGTKGFESAEVSAGGVDVRELDEKTLMSKKVKNLYFCGEVLDIDGDCGGFNLHFAWASGYLVGKSLAK